MIEVFGPILLTIIRVFPILSIVQYFVVKRYGDRKGLIIPLLSVVLIIVIPWFGIIMSIINIAIYFKVRY